jgi:hypothetical protein
VLGAFTLLGRRPRDDDPSCNRRGACQDDSGASDGTFGADLRGGNDPGHYSRATRGSGAARCSF